MNANNYPNADGEFSNAPYFNFNDDKLKFDTNRIDNANDNFGSTSGFLSEFLKLFQRPYPPAQHPTNLLKQFLKMKIFFSWNSFDILS